MVVAYRVEPPAARAKPRFPQRRRLPRPRSRQCPGPPRGAPWAAAAGPEHRAGLRTQLRTQPALAHGEQTGRVPPAATGGLRANPPAPKLSLAVGMRRLRDRLRRAPCESERRGEPWQWRCSELNETTAMVVAYRVEPPAARAKPRFPQRRRLPRPRSRQCPGPPRGAPWAAAAGPEHRAGLRTQLRTQPALSHGTRAGGAPPAAAGGLRANPPAPNLSLRFARRTRGLAAHAAQAWGNEVQ